MKNLATAIAAIALIETSAFAADMAVKAPPLPAPVYNWTGFYVGGNIGYSWGGRTDLTGIGSAPNGGVPTGFFNFADSQSSGLNGAIGGAQIGYNYQFSPTWVGGFEADIQSSGQRGGGQFNDAITSQICRILLGPPNTCLASSVPLSGTALTSYQAKIDWFGTVRARLGLLVGNQLLVYATGGLAYGRVAVSGNTSVGAAANDLGTILSYTSTTGSFGASETSVGFAVGGGLEGKFSYWLPANWTWKLEYLYVDLGSLDTATSVALAPPSSTSLSPLTSTITTHTHFADSIVRVGLNYQFH
jgi:outer membrane immunogenic protein